MSTSFNPFPPHYEFFFTLFEPLVTLGGVVFAVFSPVEYHLGLVPESVARLPVEGEIHRATIMSVRQLGSCFFLFAMFSSVLFRRIHSTLKDQPALLEPIIKMFLTCLAIADCTHIGFTFFDLGWEGTKDYQNWNTLVVGNCVITALLFVVRLCWFSGIARGSAKRVVKRKGKRN